jgi:hypothetical protein
VEIDHSKEELVKTIKQEKNLFYFSGTLEQGLYRHLDFVHLFELHYPKEV